MKISILMEALTGRFVTDTERASKRFKKQMRDMDKEASMIGRRIGAAIAVAGTAFVYATRQMVESAARLDDVSKFVNVGVESLQELTHAGEMMGIEGRGLEDSLRRLTRRAGEFANSGGGPAQKAFEALGISVRDASGAMKGTEQLFDEIVAGLQGVGSDAEVAAYAAQLFGDDYGPKLVPLLRQGEEGIAKLRAEARSLGIVMSAEAVAGAAEFSDQMDRLGKLARGFQTQLVSEMLPALQLLSERLFDAATEGGGFGDQASAAADRVVKSLAFVMDAGAGVQRVFQVWGRVLAVTLASIELGVWQLANSLINGPGKALDWLIDKANNLPGVDIEFRFGLAVPQLEGLMNRAAGIVREGVADIQGILMAPLPGQTFLDELAARAGQELPPALRTAANETRALAAAAAPVNDAAAKMIAALEQQVATLGMTDSQVQLYRLGLEGATEAQLRHAESILGTIEAHGEFARLQEEAKAVMQSNKTTAELFVDEIGKLNDMFDAGVLSVDEYNKAVARIQDSFFPIAEAAGGAGAQINEFMVQASRSAQTALADYLFDPAQEGFDGMVKGFADAMRRIIVEAAAARAATAMFGDGGVGSGGGWVGAGLNWLKGAFGGSRDSGGRGYPGQEYLIGTGAQPERFIPDTAGTFVPASQQSSGTNIFQTIVQAPEGRITRESEGRMRARDSQRGAMMVSRNA